MNKQHLNILILAPLLTSALIACSNGNSTSAPTTSAGQLYSAASNTQGEAVIYVTNLASNKVVNTINTGIVASVYSLAVAPNGTIYLGGGNRGRGVLLSYSAGVSKVIESSVGNSQIRSLALSGDTLYAGGGDGKGNGGLYAYNMSNNTFNLLESNVGYGDTLKSMVLGNDGALYMGGCDKDYNGILYEYNNSKLTTLASGIGGGCIKAITSSNNTLYALGMGRDPQQLDAIYSYSSKSGVQTLKELIGAPLNALAISSNTGMLYVAGGMTNQSTLSGAIYSLSLSNNQWNMVESNLGSSALVSILAPQSGATYVGGSGVTKKSGQVYGGQGNGLTGILTSPESSSTPFYAIGISN
ncbi:MAG: PQQ-binding-like beta-propeller repeat protein [Sphingobacteriaceae bacterium]|nr:PQQ-binding-like beta-propeller repeat protein [Sphingobacteriaceae bacterium]